MLTTRLFRRTASSYSKPAWYRQTTNDAFVTTFFTISWYESPSGTFATFAFAVLSTSEMRSLSTGGMCCARSTIAPLSVACSAAVLYEHAQIHKMRLSAMRSVSLSHT